MYTSNELITDLIASIESKYKAQHAKIAILKAKKSKLLIESQIQEEYKRKIKESNRYYIEQIEETRENVVGKEEYIKIFLKKLKEVEIFIQKHTKALNIKEYSKYNKWKISDFLKENTTIIHKRRDLYEELDKIKNKILEIKQENYFYREETITLNNKENNEEEVAKRKKINKYIEKYRKSCHVIQTKIKLIKLAFDNMSKTVKLLNVPTDLKEIMSKKNLNEDNTENKQINAKENQKMNGSVTIDKSIEISKKMESLMDFSLLLNKNKPIMEESKFEESTVKPVNFNNITYAWNLSCIQKKD